MTVLACQTCSIQNNLHMHTVSQSKGLMNPVIRGPLPLADAWNETRCVEFADSYPYGDRITLWGRDRR